MTELWQQCLIREVVNTVGREKARKGCLVLVLLNLFFGYTLVVAGLEDGAFPLHPSSRVWRQASGGRRQAAGVRRKAAGGRWQVAVCTGYRFMCFHILRRAFWLPRKRAKGYGGETLFPQYVVQIILIIRNVISFE